MSLFGGTWIECDLADARIYEVNEADEDYASYDEELGDHRIEYPDTGYFA